MSSKPQIIVFVVSFLVAGFIVLSTHRASFAGPAPIIIGCCQSSPSECSTCFEGQLCEVCQRDNFFEGVACNESTGRCGGLETIPTLNQWGKIVTIAVIGLFAVIGLIIMRRRSAVRS